jgi:hypothetical protein
VRKRGFEFIYFKGKGIFFTFQKFPRIWVFVRGMIEESLSLDEEECCFIKLTPPRFAPIDCSGKMVLTK